MIVGVRVTRSLLSSESSKGNLGLPENFTRGCPGCLPADSGGTIGDQGILPVQSDHMACRYHALIASAVYYGHGHTEIGRVPAAVVL